MVSAEDSYPSDLGSIPSAANLRKSEGEFLIMANGHGGARKNSGRKKLGRNISIRVTVEEHSFLKLIRDNSIDPVFALNFLKQSNPQ